jgi:hypothetical protein
MGISSKGNSARKEGEGPGLRFRALYLEPEVRASPPEEILPVPELQCPVRNVMLPDEIWQADLISIAVFLKLLPPLIIYEGHVG